VRRWRLAATAFLVLVACKRAPEPTMSPEPAATRSAPNASGTAPKVEAPRAVVAAHYAAMGTSVDMKVWSDREKEAREAMDAAHAEIVRLERMMTTWREDSEVARINASAGGAAVPVSHELLEVLQGAREIYDASGGVFDITFYGLKGLWHFDQDATNDIPSEDAIKARLPLIDGSKVELDATKSTVRLPTKGMLINLGGIAKGYAVDRAARVLADRGFTDVVVQAGGDLLVRGRKGLDPWRVGIRDPRGTPDNYFAVAAIHDAAFSTAGDYERGFVKDGKRYHHILDPRTGHPADACRSVTVFAPDALTADELDDAIFILGPEKGLPLVEARPGVGAVVVDKDNKVWVSKRLAGVVEIVHQPTPGI
jgi:thiamine biosynthesis lipoprotein